MRGEVPLGVIDSSGPRGTTSDPKPPPLKSLAKPLFRPPAWSTPNGSTEQRRGRRVMTINGTRT